MKAKDSREDIVKKLLKTRIKVVVQKAEKRIKEKANKLSKHIK